MQSIDKKSYQKYFSKRRENNKWSEKSKALVKELEERGIMTDFGRKKSRRRSRTVSIGIAHV